MPFHQVYRPGAASDGWRKMIFDTPLHLSANLCGTRDFPQCAVGEIQSVLGPRGLTFLLRELKDSNPCSLRLSCYTSHTSRPVVYSYFCSIWHFFTSQSLIGGNPILVSICVCMTRWLDWLLFSGPQGSLVLTLMPHTRSCCDVLTKRA